MRWFVLLLIDDLIKYITANYLTIQLTELHARRKREIENYYPKQKGKRKSQRKEETETAHCHQRASAKEQLE